MKPTVDLDLYLRISEQLNWFEIDQFIIEEMRDLYAPTE